MGDQRRLSREEIHSTLWLNDGSIASLNGTPTSVPNQKKYPAPVATFQASISKSTTRQDENYKRIHQFDKYLDQMAI